MFYSIYWDFWAVLVPQSLQLSSNLVMSHQGLKPQVEGRINYRGHPEWLFMGMKSSMNERMACISLSSVLANSRGLGLNLDQFTQTFWTMKDILTRRKTNIGKQKPSNTQRHSHHNTTPAKQNHQVQMVLPVPAELAAGWLQRSTGAGCDERTASDITAWLSGTLAAQIQAMLLLNASASPVSSLNGVFLCVLIMC